MTESFTIGYLLGIDTSTTRSKALLINEYGKVASSPYTLQTPSRSDRSRIRTSGGEAIRMVGVTGQMHGRVVLDEACEVLRSAINRVIGRTK